MSTSTTIYAETDTSLREGFPTTNYGSNSTCIVGQSSKFGIYYRNHGVFKFDVSSYTAPADIVSANLTLTVFRTSGTGDRTMKIVRLDQTFVEDQATWEISETGTSWSGGDGAEGNAQFTEPNYDITVGRDAPTETIDIKELVVDAINRRADELWIVLCFDPADTSDTPTGTSELFSSEDATESNRPKIEVTIADRVEWQGGIDGDLNEGINWSTGAIPTSSDYALFNSGSVDVNDGSLTCDKVYIGRNYKGVIGTEASTRRFICNEAYFSSPHAGIHTEFYNTTAKAYINDTSGTPDSFIFDGLYSAIINRTRHDIKLETTDATTIDAHGGAVFTCDDDVDTLRITGSYATMADIPTVVIIAGRGYAEISRVNNNNTSITMASSSSMRCLASATGSITLYSGARIRFMGNEGSPIECGEVYVYRDAILDTRTGAPTWTTTAEIFTRGGRVLFDGSRAVTVS